MTTQGKALGDAVAKSKNGGLVTLWRNRREKSQFKLSPLKADGKAEYLRNSVMAHFSISQWYEATGAKSRNWLWVLMNGDVRIISAPAF